MPATRHCAFTPSSEEPLGRVVDKVQRQGCRAHVRSALPLHHATAKVDRRSLLQQITDSGARQRDHHELLASVQRQMFRSHCAWYVPIMLLLLGPSLVFMSPVDAASLAVARTLALPYVWGALSHWRAGLDRSFHTYSLGLPDFVLLLVSLLPRALLGATVAASFAVIQWRRDKRLLTALAYAVLAAVFVVGSSTMSLRPLPCVLLNVALVPFLDPVRLGFYASLPLVCYIVFPKVTGVTLRAIHAAASYDSESGSKPGRSRSQAVASQNGAVALSCSNDMFCKICALTHTHTLTHTRTPVKCPPLRFSFSLHTSMSHSTGNIRVIRQSIRHGRGAVMRAMRRLSSMTRWSD